MRLLHSYGGHLSSAFKAQSEVTALRLRALVEVQDARFTFTIATLPAEGRFSEYAQSVPDVPGNAAFVQDAIPLADAIWVSIYSESWSDQDVQANVLAAIGTASTASVFRGSFNVVDHHHRHGKFLLLQLDPKLFFEGFGEVNRPVGAEASASPAA